MHMDREAADQMFREGALTFRDYMRVLGARFDNVRPLVQVETDDLVYVFAQIDEMKAVHSQTFGLSESGL